MTRSFGENNNNDLYIGEDGNLVIRQDIEAVLLLCKAAAEAQLLEMVLAVDQGMPNFQTIWTDAGSIAPFEAALRVQISSIPDVRNIKSLDITVIGNDLIYRAVIDTVFGEGEIDGGGL